MLLVDGKEVRDRHVHLILAPDELSFLDHVCILDALILLVEFDAVIDWVGNLCEGLLVR